MTQRCADIAAKIVAYELDAYRTRRERAALRCALGDAAHLCDALARKVRDEYRGRGGAVKKPGHDIAVWIERAGNEIWAMRELVTMSEAGYDSTQRTSQPIDTPPLPIIRGPVTNDG